MNANNLKFVDETTEANRSLLPQLLKQQSKIHSTWEHTKLVEQLA